MGLIAKVLSFARELRNEANVSDVEVNPGGDPNVTSEHFPPLGDDSFPLDTDYVFVADVEGTGRMAALGYVDPKNVPKALVGEKRIYARKEEDGTVIVDLWLKNDGTAVLQNENGSVTLKPDGTVNIVTPSGIFDVIEDGSIQGVNGNGSFELEAGGDFLVNGVIIDVNGNITTPTKVTAAEMTVDGKELKDHVHNLVVTGTNNSGTNQ